MADVLKLLAATRILLGPIQLAIERVLPDFVEEDLDDEDVRARMVEAIDVALLGIEPAAAVVPREVRLRVIRGILDLVLDDVLRSTS